MNASGQLSNVRSLVALACVACGEALAACLADCGSLHCHDCRDDPRRVARQAERDLQSDRAPAFGRLRAA